MFIDKISTTGSTSLQVTGEQNTRNSDVTVKVCGTCTATGTVRTTLQSKLTRLLGKQDQNGATIYVETPCVRLPRFSPGQSKVCNVLRSDSTGSDTCTLQTTCNSSGSDCGSPKRCKLDVPIPSGFGVNFDENACAFVGKYSGLAKRSIARRVRLLDPSGDPISSIRIRLKHQKASVADRKRKYFSLKQTSAAAIKTIVNTALAPLAFSNSLVTPFVSSSMRKDISATQHSSQEAHCSDSGPVFASTPKIGINSVCCDQKYLNILSAATITNLLSCATVTVNTEIEASDLEITNTKPVRTEKLSGVNVGVRVKCNVKEFFLQCRESGQEAWNVCSKTIETPASCLAAHEQTVQVDELRFDTIVEFRVIGFGDTEQAAGDLAESPTLSVQDSMDDLAHGGVYKIRAAPRTLF